MGKLKVKFICRTCSP